MKKLFNSNQVERESIVEDSSVNEMEKSFTQEAIETSQEENSEN
jgi:cell division protein FtsZ